LIAQAVGATHARLARSVVAFRFHSPHSGVSRIPPPVSTGTTPNHKTKNGRRFAPAAEKEAYPNEGKYTVSTD
jgi:hypothetical protein